MKISCLLFLWIFFCVSLFTATVFAQTTASGFMTPRDLFADNPGSNIALQNNTSTDTTVYGLYIRQYAEVAPGESCDSIAPDSENVLYPNPDSSPPITFIRTAGAFVTPILIPAGKRAEIGANFLYNMIYQASYYYRLQISDGPLDCALPGCTWRNDPNENWCIYLGALAPVSLSGNYTSNAPPEADLASGTTDAGSYDYNLINDMHYHYLGPISCNDQTLTCSVENSQTQSFP